MKPGDTMMWHYPHDTALPAPVELVKLDGEGWVVRRYWRGDDHSDFWAATTELRPAQPQRGERGANG